MKNHEKWMIAALKLAALAGKRGEVPIAAVLIKDGRIVAKNHNLTKTRRDPTAHAELMVLQKASQKIGNERLLETALYVTKEPCAMCAGAIVQARVPMLVFGAKDEKMGACGGALKVIPNKKLNHRPVVIKGVLAEPAAQMLKEFFQKRRREQRSLK